MSCVPSYLTQTQTVRMFSVQVLPSTISLFVPDFRTRPCLQRKQRKQNKRRQRQRLNRKKKTAAPTAKAKTKGKKDDDAIPVLAPEQVALYSKQWERFGVTKSSDQKDSLEWSLDSDLHLVLRIYFTFTTNVL